MLCFKGFGHASPKEALAHLSQVGADADYEYQEETIHFFDTLVTDISPDMIEI